MAEDAKVTITVIDAEGNETPLELPCGAPNPMATHAVFMIGECPTPAEKNSPLDRYLYEQAILALRRKAHVARPRK